MAEPFPPLPALPVPVVVDEPQAQPAGQGAPSAPSGATVTFTAVDAPLREMLTLLAETAGVSLILEDEVQGRLTVHFEGVPALEALESVARRAGYTLRSATPASETFLPRTVFFFPAVNVNRLSASEIRARFGVGEEVAEWIVTSRGGG